MHIAYYVHEGSLRINNNNNYLCTVLTLIYYLLPIWSDFKKSRKNEWGWRTRSI